VLVYILKNQNRALDQIWGTTWTNISLGQGHGEEGQGFPSEIYSRRKTTTACQISGLFVYQSLLSFVEK
jgi:hypothetical protein